MNKEEAENIKNSMENTLIKKNKIFLEVDISDRDGANFILQWMYSPTEKYKGANLLSIHWDKSLLPHQEIDHIIEMLNNLKEQ